MATLILLVACNTQPTTRPLTSCKIDRFDEGKYESVILQGAAIVLERKGGEKCVDETFTIYPDGRIVGNNGKATIGKAVSPAEVNALLARIDDLGWFRDDMFSSWHDNICSACYAYLMIVSYQDRVKALTWVDGGGGPAEYWVCLEGVYSIIPKFSDAP